MTTKMQNLAKTIENAYAAKKEYLVTKGVGQCEFTSVSSLKSARRAAKVAKRMGFEGKIIHRDSRCRIA